VTTMSFGSVLRITHLSEEAREYTVVSQAALFTTVDFAAFALFAVALLLTAMAEQVRLLPLLLALTPAVLLCALKLGTVREESLLVISELGVQKRTRFVGGRQSRHFIDRARIRAVVLSEGVSACRALFLLAFQVDDADAAGQQKLVLAFEHLVPRLNLLLVVFRGARALLLGDDAANANEQRRE